MSETGVNSFILVGLERVNKFEEALMLEYGRGFRYTRPLRVNIMDLDYELVEELVSIKWSMAHVFFVFNSIKERKRNCEYLFSFPARIILQKDSAVECLANVLATEEIEEQLDFRALRYLTSKEIQTHTHTHSGGRAVIH